MNHINAVVKWDAAPLCSSLPSPTTIIGGRVSVPGTCSVPLYYCCLFWHFYRKPPVLLSTIWRQVKK